MNIWKQSLKKRLVQLLRRLEEKGEQLVTYWDAGGDQQLVNFECIWGDEVIYKELRNAIADVLVLPHNGEVSYKGRGVIYLDEKEQIVLNFSGLHHLYWEEITPKDKEEFLEKGIFNDRTILVNETYELPFLEKSYNEKMEFYGEFYSSEGNDIFGIGIGGLPKKEEEKIKAYFVNVLEKQRLSTLLTFNENIQEAFLLYNGFLIRKELFIDSIVVEYSYIKGNWIDKKIVLL